MTVEDRYNFIKNKKCVLIFLKCALSNAKIILLKNVSLKIYFARTFIM